MEPGRVSVDVAQRNARAYSDVPDLADFVSPLPG
jgi:hypothetical protein